VKRPLNAFILFRNWYCRTQAGNADWNTQRSVNLNTTTAALWNAFTPAERAEWEARAKLLKEEHTALHPNYKYSP
ncbi:hypothetical protein GGX14DRAFT_307872, partial [Mycena pura]